MNNGRKISGGKYHRERKKKTSDRQAQESHLSLGETKTKAKRIRGGHKIHVMLRANTANIIIDGKTKKTEIKNVLETPQNRFMARQNRLMKGVIIETSLGKAKITNRPSREGNVNAVLIKE